MIYMYKYSWSTYLICIIFVMLDDPSRKDIKTVLSTTAKNLAIDMVVMDFYSWFVLSSLCWMVGTKKWRNRFILLGLTHATRHIALLCRLRGAGGKGGFIYLTQSYLKGFDHLTRIVFILSHISTPAWKRPTNTTQRKYSKWKR